MTGAPEKGRQACRSLSRRLTATGGAVIAVTAAVTALLAFQTTRDFLERRYEEQMRVLAESVALQAELGLVVGDEAMLRRVLYGVPERVDVRAVEILDAQGRVAASRRESRAGAATPVRFVETPVWTEDVTGPPPQVDHPPERRRLGTVRIVFGMGDVTVLSRTLVRRFGVFTVVVVAAAAALYGWISRSLAAPLRRLEAAAVDVARGNLQVRAPTGGFRETDQVARMFNAMLDAVEERERQLRKIHERLAKQEALAQVGRFSALVAHEIKNPLTILRGSMQALRRPDPDGTTHRMVLGFMEEETARIDRLIRDFLLFAKPLAVRRTPGDLNRWFRSVAEKMRLLAESPGVEVSVPDEAAPAAFDPELLETAVRHLLRNAVEAAPKETVVRLRARRERVLPDACSLPQGGHGETAEGCTFRWALIVEDAGPGVPEEHRERIFEPFFTTKAKGTGLGLAMVRRIVDAHKGEVSWEPGPDGTGSRFVLRLPLRAS